MAIGLCVSLAKPKEIKDKLRLINHEIVMAKMGTGTNILDLFIF